MGRRKRVFIPINEAVVYLNKNQIEAVIELTEAEITDLAPEIVSLRDVLSARGINAQIEGQITITITDEDLYEGTESTS